MERVGRAGNELATVLKTYRLGHPRGYLRWRASEMRADQDGCR
jgi:hypothetical protein